MKDAGSKNKSQQDERVVSFVSTKHAISASSSNDNVNYKKPCSTCRLENKLHTRNKQEPVHSRTPNSPNSQL